MSDETFNVELRFELEKTLEQLREAGRSSAVLDDILNELKQQFRDTEGAASGAGDAIGKALGSDLEDNTNRLRAAVEIIKTGFKELVESGRTLDEVSTAFKKLGDTELREFGPDFQAAIKAGADVAVRELREEFKQLDQQVKQSEQVAKAYSEVAKKGFGDPAISAQQFRAQVEQVKQKMLELQQTSGLALGDVVQGFRDANAVSGQFSSGVISKAASELGELDTSADRLTGTMKSLDAISVIFFGTTLGNLALSVLRRVVSQIDEFTERGTQVSRSFFNIGVAVRALQRVGLNITLAEINEQIDRLSQKFEFFSERQLREGTAQILLLTRNLKLSKQEILDLTEATAALAIVTGKDFAEEGLLVARAIASGYTEALQRAGIEASRFTIQQAAQAQGINKSFNAMTQAERAAVTLELVLRQVGNVSEDVARFQETAAGSIAESQAAIENQSDAIGKSLIPAYAGWLLFASKTLEFIAKGLDLALAGILRFSATLVETVILFNQLRTDEFVFAEGAGTIVRQFWETVNERVEEGIKTVQDSIDAADFGDLLAGEFGEFAFDLPLSTDGLETELDRLRDKLSDILFDFSNGIEDAWQNFMRRLDDIDLRELRALEDAQISFNQDVAKLQRQFADSVAEAQRKYREKELQAEIDFQEKMRQLREGFLFDLEDALRERDAKQVLRLIRQFNLRSTQLERGEQIAAEERERAFQLELQQIQEQREIRLRELAIEFEARKAAITKNADESRQDAFIRYRRELQDNEERYRRRLEQLEATLDEEKRMLINHVIELLDIAAFAVEEFNKIWAQLAIPFLGLPPLPSSGGPSGPGGPSTNPLEFAEGGTLIARQPTVAIFGEKDAEVVTFSPLNRLGRDEGKVFGGYLPGGSGMGSSMSIRIFLEEGLRGSIINQAMSELADVIIEEIR